MLNRDCHSHLSHRTMEDQIVMLNIFLFRHPASTGTLNPNLYSHVSWLVCCLVLCTYQEKKWRVAKIADYIVTFSIISSCQQGILINTALKMWIFVTERNCRKSGEYFLFKLEVLVPNLAVNLWFIGLHTSIFTLEG